MRRHRLRRLPLLVLMVGLLVVGGCARSDLTLPDHVGAASGTTATGGPDPSTLDADGVVAVALDDLAAYWDRTYPDLYGTPFEPLRGGVVAFGPRTPVPSCGPHPIIYDDVAANALYCPDEDLIAWDRVNLVPDLDQRFGPLTVGIILAHEYAHAVQVRADTHTTSVVLELQADCFAGAWVADVDDRLAVFSTAGDSLDLAIGGLLDLRDTVGVTAADPDAHGTGFDRISAFQDGFERGNTTCSDYETEAPEVVSIPFVDPTDMLQGGNLAVPKLLDLLVPDLESFYRALFTSQGEQWSPVDDVVLVDPAVDEVRCGDQDLSGPGLVDLRLYCPDDDRIYLDGTGLVPALARIGDFAVGGEVARQYAFAAQDQLGILDRYPDTGLHADCLTGVYASEEFGMTIPDQILQLSPGDLDEIVSAFVAFGGGTRASAFQRTAAFRAGFLDGYDACAAYLG